MTLSCIQSLNHLDWSKGVFCLLVYESTCKRFKAVIFTFSPRTANLPLSTPRTGILLLHNRNTSQKLSFAFPKKNHFPTIQIKTNTKSEYQASASPGQYHMITDRATKAEISVFRRWNWSGRRFTVGPMLLGVHLHFVWHLIPVEQITRGAIHNPVVNCCSSEIIGYSQCPFLPSDCDPRWVNFMLCGSGIRNARPSHLSRSSPPRRSVLFPAIRNFHLLQAELERFVRANVSVNVNQCHCSLNPSPSPLRIGSSSQGSQTWLGSCYQSCGISCFFSQIPQTTTSIGTNCKASYRRRFSAWWLHKTIFSVKRAMRRAWFVVW